MPKLKEGARVALVAPSGPVEPARLALGVKALRALGLSPFVYASCHLRHGFFAGSDALRARDLQAAFLDASIEGVFCARGGYGAHRILPLLDLPAMAAHPKFFGGYSDVTALHIALNRQGLKSYHIPMPASEWARGLDEYTAAALNSALFGRIEALRNPEGKPLRTLVPGKAEGALCGGNLTLIAASLGTPYELDARGKILFLEEIGETTRRVDGLLTQLRNAGKFRDCAGVLLGAFSGCGKERASDLSLNEIFGELIVPAGKPCLTGLFCGHVCGGMSLPLGAVARLNADEKSILVLDAD
ncbi:MAG: LD-carboxypeptidase [Christensenellaceae bacterium]|jgi:muramoyltetrapeptide carboxypeptidase|nr:LD-carboxypeptidase [Christensenellaceae bacterium]